MDISGSEIVMIVLIIVVISSMAVMLMLEEAERKKKRLEIIMRGSSANRKNKGSIKDQKRAELARKLKEQAIEERKKNKKGMSMMLRLQCAGLNVSVRKFMVLMFLVSSIISSMVLVTTSKPFFAVVTFAVCFVAVPRIVLKFLMGRRQKQFLKDFPDVLDAIVRLLRAGMPVSEAIANVSKEYGGPVGEEMSRIYNTQKIGISLPEACMEAAKRMPVTEMKIFATGIAIQAQTGSSLSSILTKISFLIRERFKLKRKIKSLSAEAKTTTGILIAIPLGISVILYFMDPDHIMVFVNTTAGNVVLGFTLLWVGIGLLFMRSLVNFKV